MKLCSYCKTEKPVEDFYKRKGKPRSECKSCSNTQNKATVSKEAKLRGQRKYREKNREALNKKHSEYKKANRHIHNAQWYRYYTKKKKSCPDWLTEEQHKQIQDIYQHARDCELVSGEKYHVDHIIPLQGENISGLHVPWNLQVLPADINIAKSNSYG